MAKRTNTSNWNLADKRYGWKFGVDGYMNSVEAARKLGKSQPWMSEILNSEGRKRPGGKADPCREASLRGLVGLSAVDRGIPEAECSGGVLTQYPV